ncbi:hypothetical protein ACTDI4_02575 [Mesorhizobium sp. PUT5]
MIGQLFNPAVWVKPSGAMGGSYRNQHELVAIFTNDRRLGVEVPRPGY